LPHTHSPASNRHPPAIFPNYSFSLVENFGGMTILSLTYSSPRPLLYYPFSALNPRVEDSSPAPKCDNLALLRLPAWSGQIARWGETNWITCLCQDVTYANSSSPEIIQAPALQLCNSPCHKPWRLSIGVRNG